MQRKAQRFSKTIGVSLLSGVVVVVAVVLLLAPRSTISYEENRLLAEKPKFSLTSLLDGSYTSGWSEYYNDTVPFRSKLKKTISAMMQWTGVQSEEDTVFFGNVSQVKKKTTTPVVTTESVETTVAVAAAGNDETNTEPAVTTTVVTTTEDPNDEPAAEIGEGIILDHKRAVCVYGGSFSVGQDYAETLNAYQQDLGSDVQVYSLVAPTAVSYYLPEEYANYTASETENIDNINSYLNGVKPVDAYNALKPHTAEAIYARTDHHWLPLGHIMPLKHLQRLQMYRLRRCQIMIRQRKRIMSAQCILTQKVLFCWTIRKSLHITSRKTNTRLPITAPASPTQPKVIC